MSWVRLTDDLLEGLMRFVGPLEAGCVPFTEKLVSDRRLALPSREHTVLVRVGRRARITGAIMQHVGGLYHPVLDPADQTIEPEAVRLLMRASRRLFSIIGRYADVDALEQALQAATGRVPVQFLDYHLMTQSTPPPERPLPRVPRGMTIRRASIRDAQLLFDIQKNYEIEEVLLPGNAFSATSTLHHLKELLKSQVVFCAEIDGRPIAKANTNARGVFYDQIGGVFTERAYRSRGVATALMMRLLQFIASEHKSGTLFVKKDNAAALALYAALGFGVEDEFRISYYR